MQYLYMLDLFQNNWNGPINFIDYKAQNVGTGCSLPRDKQLRVDRERLSTSTFEGPFRALAERSSVWGSTEDWCLHFPIQIVVYQISNTQFQQIISPSSSQSLVKPHTLRWVDQLTDLVRNLIFSLNKPFCPNLAERYQLDNTELLT